MLSVAHTWSLAAIAAVSGVVLLWVRKRFSNQERMTLAKRQARARLYAIRLYADDPWLMLRAQGQLLLWVARYLAGTLRSTAIALVPFVVLWLQLDNVYGHRSLRPGESTIVTAQFAEGADLRTLAATLEGRGVVVETPALRIPDRRLVCWRVRAVTGAPGDAALAPGRVLLKVRGEVIERDLKCGDGWGISKARWSGSPSVEIFCPAARLDILGFGVDWSVWFLVVASTTMVALRKR
jgi:hypothetical protein